MSGLIPTDFAIRGATGLTSFDVFSKDTFIGGTKGDKNLKDQLESGNVKEALTAMKRIIRVCLIHRHRGSQISIIIYRES
jgi:hypothetical protein